MMSLSRLSLCGAFRSFRNMMLLFKGLLSSSKVNFVRKSLNISRAMSREGGGGLKLPLFHTILSFLSRVNPWQNSCNSTFLTNCLMSIFSCSIFPRGVGVNFSPLDNRLIWCRLRSMLDGLSLLTLVLWSLDLFYQLFYFALKAFLPQRRVVTIEQKLVWCIGAWYQIQLSDVSA